MGFLSELMNLTRSYDENDDFDTDFADDNDDFQNKPISSRRSAKKDDGHSFHAYSSLRSRFSRAHSSDEAELDSDSDFSGVPGSDLGDNFDSRPAPSPAGGQSKVVVSRPESFADARDIGRQLRDGCVIVLRLDLVSAQAAGQILSFLGGIAFAQNGNMSRLHRDSDIIIITPSNIDITGDVIERLQSGGMYF